jgi:Carboxypeptidase regulatory-like domain
MSMLTTVLVILSLAVISPATETIPTDLSGRVLFSGVAVPGATVTAIRGDRSVSTVSDEEGTFRFANLDDGLWTLRVEMRGFVTMTRDVTLPLSDPPIVFALTMRPYEEIVVPRSTDKGPAKTLQPPANVEVETTPPETADIINGSVINGAATAFAQPRAFGNNRPRPVARYTGGVSALLGNSAWNARPYSFDGASAAVPSYSDLQLGVTLGGPLKIPWLLSYGPQTFVNYQHGVQHSATTQSALMPSAAERQGNGVIPPERISPSAIALLAYYPLPNIEGTDGTNFQTPLLSKTTQDNLQLSTSQSLRRRATLSGSMALQRTVTDSDDIFDFTDRSRLSSLNASANLIRQFSLRLVLRVRYQFTRSDSEVTPFFANRTNVSADAGISGNSQDPLNWGPPTLSFPDLAGLRDANYHRSTVNTHTAGGEIAVRRGTHNVTMGGDVRWTGVDISSEQNPRGALSFTGAVTGDAFADFLLGVPSTSSIAFGNRHSHLRGTGYDAYVTDDWRLTPGLTLNLGVRWEYEAPFTETSNGLVNLDVAPAFTAISPVVATNPVGSLTGSTYPASLLRPDRRGVQPRLAASWRPVLGSSFIVRTSYGIYRNLGVYQPLAILLTQQPPISNTFALQNSLETPLTLANPFPASLPTTSNTFAVDPDFRPGYAHTWQVSAQRDLPASLTVIAAYLGARGSQLMQAFLPNTYPAGAENPCPDCPSGFVYVTSTGSSVRNAGQFTVRRRLHHGLTATVQYTIAKSTDDAATFSNTSVTPSSIAVAQDWLNLSAERGPSSFDQRHLVSVQFQYTTGMGIAAGTLVDGVRGVLFKDWTITSQLNAGSGLPLTPISFLTVAGTGFVGVRPRLTGVSPDAEPPGYYANPDAYAAPLPATWGDAGRNSIRGPSQFSLDMSVSRVFRLGGSWNLEWRVAATNVLNRVTFSTIDTVVTSPQFGLPTVANPMRRIQTSFRLRF